MIRLAGENELADISREIDLAIEHEVHELGMMLSLQSRVKDHIRERLKSTTHRTYLWLYLVLAVLRSAPRATKRHLDEAIDHLSRTVNDAYDRILNRSPNKGQAERLLQIVLAARRPLNLLEMNIALNMTEESKSYTDLDFETGAIFKK